MHAETDSNAFRPFSELFGRFEFEFCRRGNYFRKTIRFFEVYSGFDDIHCDCTCVLMILITFYVYVHKSVKNNYTVYSQTLSGEILSLLW